MASGGLPSRNASAILVPGLTQQSTYFLDPAADPRLDGAQGLLQGQLQELGLAVVDASAI